MEQLVADVRAHLLARKPAWEPLTYERSLKACKLSMVANSAGPATLFLCVEPSINVNPYDPHSHSTMISKMEAQCEVLALLTFLARLDLLAWRDQMVEIWTRLAVEVDAAVKTSAPFQLGLEITFKDYTGTHIDGQATFKGLKEWVISPRKASTSYQDLVSRAALMTDNPQHIDIPVRILLDSSVHQLRDVLALVGNLAALLLPNKAWWRLQEVGIDSAVECVMTEEALALTVQLIDAGVVVRDLPSISCTDAVTLLDTLHRLVPPSQATPPAYPGVATVVISDIAPWEANLAVLSALVYSGSVHRIQLRTSRSHNPGYTVETKRVYWRWVAYAVLSSEAKHKASEIVAFDWHVEEEELAMMREVLDAEDPLAVLMEETRDAAVDTAVVCANRFYFSAPWETTGQDAAEYTSSEALLVLTVKKVGDLGWSVLLPGYGKAWVRACDGVVTEATCSKARPRLDVTCELTNMTAAIALCTAVGLRMRTLKLSKIHTSEDQDSDVWLRAVLTQCPLLEEFTVGHGMQVGHLAVFVDTPGAPRLRKLKIRATIDEIDSEDDRLPTEGRATAFWQALADPQHPLARSLEDLHLHFQVCDDECEEFFDAVRAVLDHNRRLHYFYLDIQSMRWSQIEVQVQAAALEYKYGTLDQDDVEFDSDDSDIERDERLVGPVICTIPVPMRAKLAVLSALSRFQNGTAQLDSSILASMFEFAATAHEREFYCFAVD